VVLHSRGDGILGADNSKDEALWRKALSFKHPLATTAWIAATADDSLDDIAGYFRGAYDKKWWSFPSYLNFGFGPAVEKLYKDYLPLRFEAWMTAHPQRTLATPKALKQTVQENWTRLEKDILTEANALWQPCIDCLRNGERPSDYTLPAPLNHQASVSPEVAKDYVLRLKKLAGNNWVPEQRPRPALGYVGFNEVAGERAGLFRDRFIENKLFDESWLATDQSKWLFSHSGMRIPSEEVFDRSYRAEIIRRISDGGVDFGRY